MAISCFGRSAEIRDVNFIHEVIKNNEKGMTVKVTFSIYGCQYQECDAIIFFYNRNGGAQIPKQDSGYRYDKKWLCTFSEFKPKYDSSKYTDYEFFIPYSAFHLPNGPYELDAEIVVRCNLSEVHKSGKYPFEMVKYEYGCYSCNSSGVCFLCSGAGGYSSMGYQWYICRGCGGRKYCLTCGGRGTLSSTKTLNCQYNTTSQPVQYGTSTYATPNAGSAKIRTTRKKCRVCNNGRIKVPISAVNSNYEEICAECGEKMKITKHIHQDCGVCYGTGYMESNEAIIE